MKELTITLVYKYLLLNNGILQKPVRLFACNLNAQLKMVAQIIATLGINTLEKFRIVFKINMCNVNTIFAAECQQQWDKHSSAYYSA
jgi:hypothetical protein